MQSVGWENQKEGERLESLAVCEENSKMGLKRNRTGA